jgi:hypothetical protein
MLIRMKKYLEPCIYGYGAENLAIAAAGGGDFIAVRQRHSGRNVVLTAYLGQSTASCLKIKG